MLVEKRATNHTELEIATILREAHKRAFGGATPTMNRLGCVWAQVMLEHGREAHQGGGLETRALWDNCFGNVTAPAAWCQARDWYVIHVAERVKRDPDVWKDLDLKFKSFGVGSGACAIEGAQSYLNLLGGRYLSALKLFDVGDARGGCFELSRLNYYTALPEPYSKAVVSLKDYFDKNIGPHITVLELPHVDPVCLEPDMSGECHSTVTDDDLAVWNAWLDASIEQTKDDIIDELRRDARLRET